MVKMHAPDSSHPNVIYIETEGRHILQVNDRLIATMYHHGESPTIIANMKDIDGAVARYKEWREYLRKNLNKKTIKSGIEVSQDAMAADVAVTLFQNLVRPGWFMHMAKESKRAFSSVDHNEKYSYHEADTLETYWSRSAYDSSSHIVNMIERTTDIKKKADIRRLEKTSVAIVENRKVTDA